MNTIEKDDVRGMIEAWSLETDGKQLEQYDSENKLSYDRLNVATVYWQNKLRLDDWDLDVVFVTHMKDVSEYYVGRMNHHSQDKTADIAILDEDNYPKNTTSMDQEHTLVHELLEIHMESYKCKLGSAKHTAQEVTINRVATALVSLRREAADANNRLDRISKDPEAGCYFIPEALAQEQAELRAAKGQEGTQEPQQHASAPKGAEICLQGDRICL